MNERVGLTESRSESGPSERERGHFSEIGERKHKQLITSHKTRVRCLTDSEMTSTATNMVEPPRRFGQTLDCRGVPAEEQNASRWRSSL